MWVKTIINRRKSLLFLKVNELIMLEPCEQLWNTIEGINWIFDMKITVHA